MRYAFFFTLSALIALSCSREEATIEEHQNQFNQDRLIELKADVVTLSNDKSSSLEQLMSSVNASLASQGLSLQLNAIEAYSADGMGNTVFFNDRGNKQLSGDFVPADPRRGGFTDIAYLTDGFEGGTNSGLTAAQTTAAIDNAMSTWDAVTCSNGLNITNLGSTPFDVGYLQALFGFGGSFLFTDLMHSGWNQAFTDFLFGPGNSVLGVAFTFVFIDGGGNATDIDNNGKDDVAFRDIYYNDAFPWAIGNNIDVETVALHEAGHGLSQAHFGKLFQNNGNGNFQFAPRAVMNAGYTGVQTTIEKTDKAGHCSNWAQWPNN